MEQAPSAGMSPGTSTINAYGEDTVMTIYLTKRLRALRPVVALAATAFLCAGSDAAQQPCGQSGDIDTLFKFSQRAERPQDQLNESLNCPAEGAILTVPNLPAEPFPSWTTDAVTEALLAGEAPGSPFPELSQDPPRLYVVCPRIDIDIDIGIGIRSIRRDIAVEMMVLRTESGADTVRLDVVTREPDDPQNERSAGEWTPVIGPQGLITFPGTDPDDWTQILANFFHEPCLFPAAHLALHALCTVPNTTPPSDSRGTARTSETSAGPVNRWLRIDDYGRPIVVGHSLGGAVTQYIAISKPPEGRSTGGDSENACSGVNAYTFGSTGLITQTAGDAHPIYGNLTSYASDCDFLVHCVPSFRGRVQPGHVFTLRSDTHWIDDIQEEICNCRQWAGSQVLHDHGTRAQPPENRSLFGLRRDSNGYCPGQQTDCLDLLIPNSTEQ